MKVDLKQVEEACKELYIRALKLLPPDVKRGSTCWPGARPTRARSARSAP